MCRLPVKKKAAKPGQDDIYRQHSARPDRNFNCQGKPPLVGRRGVNNAHARIAELRGCLCLRLNQQGHDSHGTGYYGWRPARVWWVLGALILMPVILGMGVQFSKAFDQMHLMSMMGHAIFGILLGLVFVFYTKKTL